MKVSLALEQVEKFVGELKQAVVESKGFMYQMDSLDKFQAQLETASHEYVLRLKGEIDRSVDNIFKAGEGGDLVPLEACLDDPKLESNSELFIEIVTKHMAAERFQVYQ